MSAEPVGSLPYRIDFEGDDLVVRMNAALMSREEIIDALDLFLLEKRSRELALSEDEIATLAKEVNRAAWQRLRPMVEEKLRTRD